MFKEKRISLRFDSETWSFVKHLAVKKECSINQMVRNVIYDLKKNEEGVDIPPAFGKMAPSKHRQEG